MATGEPMPGMIWDDTLGWILPTDPISFALSRTILAGQKMTWQPIETAPKNGTPILIFDHGDIVVAVHVDTSYLPWRGTYGDGDAAWEPTHWMQLPEPPK